MRLGGASTSRARQARIACAGVWCPIFKNVNKNPKFGARYPEHHIFCCSRFTSLCGWVAHRRHVHGGARHVCYVCGHTVAYAHSLRRHLEVNHGVMPAKGGNPGLKTKVPYTESENLFNDDFYWVHSSLQVLLSPKGTLRKQIKKRKFFSFDLQFF